MSKRTLFNYYSSSNGSTPSLENNENTRPLKLSRVEFRSSDIVSDPGMRKPINEHPFDIRDQVKRAYALRGPTHLLVFHFLASGRVVNGDPSNKVGLQNMIGWSIVNQRMLHFACIVIFSLSPASLKNLGVMSLQKKFMRNGRRLWKDLISMLPPTLTTMQL